MPELKEILPLLTNDARFRNSEAYTLRNQQVTAIRLATDAPCSSYSELFSPWPGQETGVTEWYALENGFAVGKVTYQDGGEFYPVTCLTQK